ncbi:MAG: hypothetical protein L3K16_03805, partial [Thermoplasmata archaeon]|nr:hypothetical protein [Thermoplasmata archaeon]
SLASRKRRTIVAALESKGFVAESRKKHVRYHFLVDGKDTGSFTFVSHGPGREELGDSLLRAMANEIGVKKREFEQLVDCSWSEADLKAELGRQGVL